MFHTMFFEVARLSNFNLMMKEKTSFMDYFYWVCFEEGGGRRELKCNHKSIQDL